LSRDSISGAGKGTPRVHCKFIVETKGVCVDPKLIRRIIEDYFDDDHHYRVYGETDVMVAEYDCSIAKE